MTTQEMLKFCSVCEHREMDEKRGILCSLTHKKADFKEECPSYTPDAVAIHQRSTSGHGKRAVSTVSIAAGVVMSLALVWFIIGLLYYKRIFVPPIILFIIAAVTLVSDHMKGRKDSSKEYEQMKESDLLNDH